ncbi:MAG TPA: hypothetical protein VFM18_19080 [Methanosarcina sp.]|nr:hypothetical protein [Methanosarcina sp.]
MNIYTDAFKPTYLCIKQHTITGKLYFCKTTKPHDKMLSYKGSGRYWNRHLKVHGKEHVETIWYCLFYDKDELVKFALSFSTQQNIVESIQWANEKPENGLDGNPNGIVPWNKGKTLNARSAEHSANISTSLKGKASKLKGISRPQFTNEHRANMSSSKQGSKNSNAKTYQFTDPSGKVYIVTGGITAFCKEHRLRLNDIIAVTKFRKDSYKGWTVALISTTNTGATHGHL